MTYATITTVQELLTPQPSQRPMSLKRLLLRWKAYQRQQRRAG